MNQVDAIDQVTPVSKGFLDPYRFEFNQPDQNKGTIVQQPTCEDKAEQKKLKLRPLETLINPSEMEVGQVFPEKTEILNPVDFIQHDPVQQPKRPGLFQPSANGE